MTMERARLLPALTARHVHATIELNLAGGAAT